MERNAVATIAKSESSLLLFSKRLDMELTSFAIGQSQKSNDSAQAHGLLVGHQSLSLKTKVQKPLHPSKSPAVLRQEASVRKSNARKIAREIALKLQIDERDVQSGERETVSRLVLLEGELS
jgi:hypothetical protein